MAKTVFSGKTKEKEEMLPLCESHPQKEKVERYAASFRKLADTFYGMPYRKEFLSGGQLNRIISDTSAAVCSRCYQREICWGERAGETMRGSEETDIKTRMRAAELLGRRNGAFAKEETENSRVIIIDDIGREEG